MIAPRPVRKAVVTGASGFIGRRLCARLRDSGAEVAEWSRASVDLLDADAVGRALSEGGPDTIFHLAAAGVSGTAAHDPANVGADVTMLANLISRATAGTRLIVTGSMSEYGASGVLNEADRCTPKTAYGIGKLAASLYALAYAPRRRVEVTVARLFGVYGPGESPHRFFPTLVRDLREGREVALSDGLQRRDFVHVDDACRALIAIAGRVTDEAALVNVGTGGAVRVRDVAEWIADSLGASRDLLLFGARPRSPGDEDLLQADVGRLRALTGEVPAQRLGPNISPSLFEGEATPKGNGGSSPLRTSRSGS